MTFELSEDELCVHGRAEPHMKFVKEGERLVLAEPMCLGAWKEGEPMKRPALLECPGHQRHWFTKYGEVGHGVGACVRCGITDKQLSDWRKRARRKT